MGDECPSLKFPIPYSCFLNIWLWYGSLSRNQTVALGSLYFNPGSYYGLLSFEAGSLDSYKNCLGFRFPNTKNSVLAALMRTANKHDT